MAGVVFGLAACSHAPQRNATAMYVATGSVAGASALIVDGNPGYSADAEPGYIASFAYQHAASCGESRDSGALRVAARWHSHDGVTALTAMAGAFDQRRGSLVIPFLTFIVHRGDGMIPATTVQRWITTPVTGNFVSGLHSTGWVRLGGKAPSWQGRDLLLTADEWTLTIDNTYRCVGEATVALSPGGH